MGTPALSLPQTNLHLDWASCLSLGLSTPTNFSFASAYSVFCLSSTASVFPVIRIWLVEIWKTWGSQILSSLITLITIPHDFYRTKICLTVKITGNIILKKIFYALSRCISTVSLLYLKSSFKLKRVAIPVWKDNTHINEQGFRLQ